MKLKDFLKAHPEFEDLHIILVDGGILKVYPGAETVKEGRVLEIADTMDILLPVDINLAEPAKTTLGHENVLGNDHNPKYNWPGDMP